MNSKFLRQTVLPRKNLPHIKYSLLSATTITDERIIITSRGKTHCKSLFLEHQLAVFFVIGKIHDGQDRAFLF
jgi:hypothetical protein